MQTTRLALCGAVLAGCSRTTGFTPIAGVKTTALEARPTSTVLFEFNSKGGAHPLSGMIDVDGTLYGTASEGGGHRHGAVFKIDSSGEHILYSFRGGLDGAYPTANLNYVDGKFYGVTSMGGFDGCSGSRGCGTVFAVTPSGKETVLHVFGGGLDGSGPQARLTDVKGVLYGTTVEGGGYADDGTVFKITTTGRETILHAFKGGNDGAHPKGRLTNVGGVLYGTAYDGGKYDRGTAFKITTAGKKQNLYSFGAYTSDAANPAAGLTYLDGNFYGTTAEGGTFCYYLSACGTVYSMTPMGSERVLYNFQEGDDGAIPVAALTAIDGILYGSTYDGPVQGYQPYFGCGSIFKITTSGQFTVLSSLGGSYGCHPTAPVTRYGNGIAVTASRGGAHHYGAAFELTP
jgi:uncharacterized repeat protein (TIGR03803 family)